MKSPKSHDVVQQGSESFWLKPLDELSSEQWELLCDGCGRCCHQKYEDEDTGELFLTNIACALFDDQTCQCRDYASRQNTIADCLSVRQMERKDFCWLPETCAYRLRDLGLPLHDWHHLRSGDCESVHKAGVSMRGCSVYPEGDDSE